MAPAGMMTNHIALMSEGEHIHDSIALLACHESVQLKDHDMPPRIY